MALIWQVAKHMKLQFMHGDDLITLEAERAGDGWKVVLPDGSLHSLIVARTDEDVLHLTETVGDSPLVYSRQVPFASDGDNLDFSYAGNTYRFQTYRVRSAARKPPKASSGVLIAPMTGVVSEMLVTVGETVIAYQPLAVIEAMKVMSTLDAPFAGTVKMVYVQAQQQVTHGAPIIEIVPVEKSEIENSETDKNNS